MLICSCGGKRFSKCWSEATQTIFSYKLLGAFTNLDGELLTCLKNHSLPAVQNSCSWNRISASHIEAAHPTNKRSGLVCYRGIYWALNGTHFGGIKNMHFFLAILRETCKKIWQFA